MITVNVCKKTAYLQPVPKIRATELRRTLWNKFGHKCVMVKTEKKPNRTVIHVKVLADPDSPKAKKIVAFTTYWDEIHDFSNKQVINIMFLQTV